MLEEQNLTSTLAPPALSPLLQKCFDESYLLLMPDIEKRINNYIFPIQFMITVVGNLLTMTVLLSGHIKNRANHLLTSLALCDMLVFFMMIPHYLASLDTFSRNPTFRLFQFHSKPHFGALSNWFSAAAIWFVLAVSLERLLIIKFPFRSLDVHNGKQIVVVSVGIMVSTLFLTSYHHFSHTCITYIACHGTQILGKCYPNTEDMHGRKINPTSLSVKQYLHTSVYANALLAVLLPIFAVAVLNISLIRLVKRRHSEELLVRNAAGPSSMAEQEKKMTHTVLAIVSCFTLTQGPSAIVFISQKMFPPNQYSIYISVVANQLVLTGKMLNVVLFCLTSETFRRRLWLTCRFWCQLIFYAGRNKTSRFSGRTSRVQSRSSLKKHRLSTLHAPETFLHPERSAVPV
ncbi:G-protein coupled receptors family 1 profile domain-containing protein [Caenorhabditis elegans]|uniref:G-protein coupled receptors family 1 profile domain-containing protein n=1 Tax=Caenorhabditis elegans TaxID=6239 RepID=U4PR79_CAEEL|nr:G-protein coupled receptors family 1 profile domain-containing protein [Caenorhabditis elegans]CDH93068.1 G-protein coupled receptors family 1 profile domain-containing protein [Caenorhabditis elegans]|eukprot:NP_001294346.1 Uncharacterized protein CELE_K03H6.5 [Caenorhabditis elegans]